MSDITFIQALTAGVISFISPCVLPLIPAYASLMAAFMISGRHKKTAIAVPLSFLAGFLTVFVLTGTSFGVQLAGIQGPLRITGSILTILTGLYALLYIGIPDLRGRPDSTSIPATGVSILSLMIGIGFASGWTPCIGPSLGLILVNASTQGTAGRGLLLLITYALGLAVPFLIVALVIKTAMNTIKNKMPAKGLLMIAACCILLIMGGILFKDNLRQLTPLFPDLISY